MVGDTKWSTDMRKSPDNCPGLHSKVHVQQQGSVKSSITVNTLKIWHFQLSDMQVRDSAQPFADCCFQIRLYKARSKSGKQARQGAAWMTACETLLLERGSMPASSFLWCFPFRFESTVYLCLFWRFFFLWTLHSCFMGKQSHGSTSRKKKKAFLAPASRVQASYFICFWILAHIQTPYNPSPCWQQWVCQFPVSLSVRGIVRASSTSGREGNYFETYVAIGT